MEQTQSAHQGQWFHDYLADLDVLVQTFFPDGPMSLVGHSLGGNVASVYAGLRPEKVKRMVSIDGFGMIPMKPADFRDLLSHWIDARRKSQTQALHVRFAEMADKLVAANRRLTRDKALFLAGSMSRPLDDGGFTWQFDLVDRRSMPTMRSLEEWAACWRDQRETGFGSRPRIRAPERLHRTRRRSPGSSNKSARARSYACRKQVITYITIRPERWPRLSSRFCAVSDRLD